MVAERTPRTDQKQVDLFKFWITSAFDQNLVPENLMKRARVRNFDHYSGVSLSARFVMADLYNRRFDEPSKVLFCKATAELIRDWTPVQRKNVSRIRNLAYLSAQIGLQEAIPEMIGLVEKDFYLDEKKVKTQEWIETKADLISVIAGTGFQRTDETQKTLEKWLLDPKYKDFAGMLMVGLSFGKPADYLLYLMQYLSLEGIENQDEAIAELIDIITPDVIKQHLEELPQSIRERVEEILEKEF